MINDKSVLIVIIGRAGSKGLPGKNALDIAGHPMIFHTIEDAKNVKCDKRIIVSTDGDDIAQSARDEGIQVIQRPADLATDTATVDGAVRHAVNSVQTDADIIVILYANVPVRPEGLIDCAVRTLIETGADSVQSYSNVGKYHPYWMVTMDDDGKIEPHIQNTVYRRQDLPKLLIPDGGVIAVRRESLFNVVAEQPHSFLGSDRRGIENRHGAVITVIDVDTEADLAFAESILLNQVNQNTGNSSSSAETIVSC